jgi:hypothetical protein
VFIHDLSDPPGKALVDIYSLEPKLSAPCDLHFIADMRICQSILECIDIRSVDFRHAIRIVAEKSIIIKSFPDSV